MNSARVLSIVLTFAAVLAIAAGSGWAVAGVLMLALAAVLVALDVLVKDPQAMLAKLKDKQVRLLAGPDAFGPKPPKQR